MKKKIIAAIVSVIVVAGCVTLGWFIGRQQSNDTNSPSVNIAETKDNVESTGENANESESNQTSGSKLWDSTDESEYTGSDSKSLEKLILGEWTDNANFSGYEFLEDGIMKVTYFNMELLDLDDVISGTYTGTYKLDGNKLTISYTIYSKAVVKTYTASVDENTLTLKDEVGESSIYVKKGATTKMDNVDKKLLGAWKSNLNGYEFFDTGVVAITFIDLSSMGINLPISGKVNGVYTINGNKLSVKYSIYTGVIEKNFKYEIDGKVLTLTDLSSGDVGTYIKDDSANN